MAEHAPPIVGSPVVERVLLCDFYERNQLGLRTTSSSLPGHLIQLHVSGRTTHEAGGRRYVMEPGSLIWYHEDELVNIEVHETPWRFFTLNFIATQLSPPPFEQRVRRVGRSVRRRFEQLLATWRGVDVEPTVREMRVQAHVLSLLAELTVGRGEPFVMDPSAELWWRIETQLRRDLSVPIDLSRMVEISGRSPATIARSCHAAVGISPMQRIKQVRMSLARGLVHRSDLRISEIAERIGYTRVHEFSRDYRKHFGRPPTHDRP
jgi:AraC-like DNA-binding protein